MRMLESQLIEGVFVRWMFSTEYEGSPVDRNYSCDLSSTYDQIVLFLAKILMLLNSAAFQQRTSEGRKSEKPLHALLLPKPGSSPR